ncbi:MAG: ATP-binding protein [Spirochaetaceae bacterium]|nr:MAG: ATP-binding protein [Spirochaetaceae bacterium]
MHWTLSDMILDLAHNSLEAGADLVDVTVEERQSLVRIEISDNGKGMDQRQRALALDPFYTEPGKHPGRKVGLGLPFLVQTVEQTGGRYELESEPGVGTRLVVEIDAGHVDTPPIGDLAQIAAMLMCFDGDYELRWRRRRTADTTAGVESGYEVERSQLREALGDLAYVSSRSLASQYLRACEDEIQPMEGEESWRK